MADNPYVNKVDLADGSTLIDLTGDTATESDVVRGKTFHLSSGATGTGSMDVAGSITDAEVDSVLADSAPTGTASLRLSQLTRFFAGLKNKFTNTKVKGDAETDYRTGNVNITPANIGALSLAGGTMTGDGGIQFPTASGNNKSNNYISAGGGYSTGSGKNGLKVLSCEQSDCSSGLGQDLTGTSSYELDIVAGCAPSDNSVGSIVFAKHDSANSPSTYTKLAWLDMSGNLNARQYFTTRSQFYFDKNVSVTGNISLTGVLNGGAVIIPHSGGNYNEGLRINRYASGNWAVLTIGCSPDTTAGIEDYGWFIASPPTSNGRQLRISHNTSGEGTYFFSESSGNTVGLNVNGKMRFRRVLTTSESNGTTYLSDYAYNYNHMRIFYRTSDSTPKYASIDVDSPNGKNVALISGHSNSSGSGNIKTKVVTISGSTITTVGAHEIYVNGGGSWNSGFIYITRVEAWNE
jgi:hypothetical protein